MKILRYSLMFLVALLLSIGCTISTQDGFKKEPAKLEPITEKLGKYAFPIPSNFIRKDDLSMVYENKNIVRAYLVYVGRAKTQRLINFFDKYMSKSGWNKELFIAGEDTVLAYSRENQLIVIKIQQTFNSTILKILLTTK